MHRSEPERIVTQCNASVKVESAEIQVTIATKLIRTFACDFSPDSCQKRGKEEEEKKTDGENKKNHEANLEW